METKNTITYNNQVELRIKLWSNSNPNDVAEKLRLNRNARAQTKLPLKDLIFVLNHIFRWVFPHRLYLKELIDMENECHKIYIEKLRNNGIRFNLDLLENGRTLVGRKKISKDTGIPESIILDYVRARLPKQIRREF